MCFQLALERESLRLSPFSEETLPASESSHAIKVAIDEALKCKETGEEIKKSIDLIPRFPGNEF